MTDVSVNYRLPQVSKVGGPKIAATTGTKKWAGHGPPWPIASATHAYGCAYRNYITKPYACHVVFIISSIVFFNFPTKTDTFTPNSHSLL